MTDILNSLGDYRIGRVLLHMLAVSRDHEFAFHFAGICREF